MSDNQGGSKIAIFLAGVGLGAIVALLFAPRSGEETRELISRKAEESRDYLESRGRELKKQTQEAVERGRRTAEDLVGKAKDLVSDAIR